MPSQHFALAREHKSIYEGLHSLLNQSEILLQRTDVVGVTTVTGVTTGHRCTIQKAYFNSHGLLPKESAKQFRYFILLYPAYFSFSHLTQMHPPHQVNRLQEILKNFPDFSPVLVAIGLTFSNSPLYN